MRGLWKVEALCGNRNNFSPILEYVICLRTWLSSVLIRFYRLNLFSVMIYYNAFYVNRPNILSAGCLSICPFVNHISLLYWCANTRDRLTKWLFQQFIFILIQCRLEQSDAVSSLLHWSTLAGYFISSFTPTMIRFLVILNGSVNTNPVQLQRRLILVLF